MKDVACNVHTQTGGFQLPYRTSSLTGKVFLVTNTDVPLGATNVNDFFILDDALRDPRYDRDYTNVDDRGKRFTRGGERYLRPCGSIRYAIRVIGKYENEDWLGSSNGPNEWPVSYNGARQDVINSIASNGFDLGKPNRFVHGPTIHTTPNINFVKGFSKSFTVNAEEYLVVLQNRVNPKNLIKKYGDVTDNVELWISPTAADIRPYGICIMKK